MASQDVNPPSPPSAATGNASRPSPIQEPPRSAAFAALEYTGIPKSWLRTPKLPSRNWLIFIGLVSTTTYLYWDDRRQCKAIRRQYVEKVKHLAEVPLGSMDLPRKVQVFACKWPGDEEYDRSMKYFRKYVKVSFLSLNDSASMSYLLVSSRYWSQLPLTMT